MRGLLTTRDQHCWKELIEKEAFSRVSWKVKYGHKFPTLEPCSGPRRKCILPAICPPKEQEERLSPPRTQEEGTGFKKQGEGISLPGKQEDKDQEPLLKEMRPATPKTKHLLYQGISQEGKGRHLYLQERKLKNPEEKFHYPVLSSWEYGWRLGLGKVVRILRLRVHFPDLKKSCVWLESLSLSLTEVGPIKGDVITEIKAPIHARSGIVKDTFYIRNGVFHHPSKSDKLS